MAGGFDQGSDIREGGSEVSFLGNAGLDVQGRDSTKGKSGHLEARITVSI